MFGENLDPAVYKEAMEMLGFQGSDVSVKVLEESKPEAHIIEEEIPVRDPPQD